MQSFLAFIGNLLITFTIFGVSVSNASPSPKSCCLTDMVQAYGIDSDPTKLDSFEYSQFLLEAQKTCEGSTAKPRLVANGFCHAREWKHALYCWKQDSSFDCNYNYGDVCYWQAYKSSLFWFN